MLVFFCADFMFMFQIFLRIKESCTLLGLLRGSAILLQEALLDLTSVVGGDLLGDDCAHRALAEISVRHLTVEDALRVLNQRTDLNLNQ